MEEILDDFVCGLYSAAETAARLIDHWTIEAGGSLSGGILAGRIACLNEPLRNAMVDLLNLKK